MRRVKTRKLLLLLLAVPLLMNASCASKPSAFQSSVPSDLMASCTEDDLLQVMLEAMDEAEGLNELWLLDYAGTAQECNLRLQGIQAYERSINP